MVGIEVVEGEPFFEGARGEAGEAFVDGGPAAEYFEPGGAAFEQGGFEVECALVADVVHEIHVDGGHGVFD